MPPHARTKATPTTPAAKPPRATKTPKPATPLNGKDYPLASLIPAAKPAPAPVAASPAEPLVYANGGEPVTTTERVAVAAEVQHASVIKLVRLHLGDFKEFGPIRFQIRMGNRGGVPVEYAELNEAQATLLFTYLRNTAPVRGVKVRLIKEFASVKAELAAAPAPAALSNAPRATDPASFYNFDGKPVRHVVLPDGDVGLVAKDVAERLGYVDTAQAVRQHCKGALIQQPLSTPGGIQNLRIIKEPDVMRLIVSSKLPSAQRFEAWVFEELLPQIRKTGAYLPDGHVSIEREKLQRLLEADVRRTGQDLQFIAEKVEAESKAKGSISGKGLRDRRTQKEPNKKLIRTVSVNLQMEMFGGSAADKALADLETDAGKVARVNGRPDVLTIAVSFSGSAAALSAMQNTTLQITGGAA